MLGGQDPITVNSQVRDYVDRIDNDRCRVIEYENAGHTLEFEPDPQPYFRDLTAWCREVATQSRLSLRES